MIQPVRSSRSWSHPGDTVFERGGELEMKHRRWDDIEHEELSPGLARRVLHGDGLTVARIYLKKGAIVPLHQHVNEQLSYVLEGRLRFDFEQGQQVVAAGEMMQISANEPHEVEALEDSVAFDVFQPVREDWLRGDDSYLRNPISRPKRNKIET
jgi:quercetin dioxygenase-like cupin family protein